MTEIAASLLNRAWRKVDIKLSIGGAMRILRWRSGWFSDEVLFDERHVAATTGLISRETIYGLEIDAGDGAGVRFLLMIDPAPDWTDWSGDARPGGVRLETADRVLIAQGTHASDRIEPFRKLYDRAIKAMGL